MLGKNKFISFALMSLLSTASIAANAGSDQIIVTPNCLIKSIGSHYQSLSKGRTVSLIKVNEHALDALIAAKVKQKDCGGFINVTHEWEQFKSNTLEAKTAAQFLASYESPPKPLNAKTPAYQIHYTKAVNQLMKEINPNRIWNSLTIFTKFEDRYAGSEHGVEAAQWLAKQIEMMAKQYGRKDVEIRYIQTGNYYKQPSVVVKVGTSDQAGVVVGGHMDTLSGRFSKKPGADDDGSGSMTVLETARVILSSHLTFKKPIYFAWYAAEEEGLVGSQYVVEDFKNKNIPVDAVIHFDMTGYAYKNDPTIWLITDNVDDKLTDFLRQLITVYVKQPVKYTRCGYACSDHASWYRKGYASSIAFEGSFNQDNPYIHTSQDTTEKLSLTHMTDYAKLSVAFAVELAEPIN